MTPWRGWLFAAAVGVAAGFFVAPAQAEPCCKVCKKGKACGDSCIARDKACTEPPGCACDGASG